MKRRGWFRLWVVATAIGVPAFALWMSRYDSQAYGQSIRFQLDLCDEKMRDDPQHSNYEKCVHDGTTKDMYQTNGTTPARYWSLMLGVSFLVDLVLTALLVGAFYVIRWIVRGFKDHGRPANT